MFALNRRWSGFCGCSELPTRVARAAYPCCMTPARPRRFVRGRLIISRGAVVIASSMIMTSVIASPASAHVTKPSDAQHYRSVVTGIVPASAPFSVRVGRTGDWIEVRALGATELNVQGYFGEPYLLVTAAQVKVNTLSPTAEMNGGLLGTFGPAQIDNARLPAHWVVSGPGPVAHWHDLRTQWAGGGRPVDVAADPHHHHVIDNWQITVVSSDETYAVNGTLSWTPIRVGVTAAMAAFFAVDTAVLVGGALLVRRWLGARRSAPSGSRRSQVVPDAAVITRLS